MVSEKFKRMPNGVLQRNKFFQKKIRKVKKESYDNLHKIMDINSTFFIERM